ncbi:MAG TPA: hypothetical protein VLF18_17075 [Tahibacter sp.]|uniref:hypothetical protein n=1 Tax=Tahibacter sp. TaxID=2056211 RepID=UPI002BFB8ED7|nr:hypothetical protein [Tahibacter sp.]HSX61904.1 hypothetical protein [Tahibacter sp.]
MSVSLPSNEQRVYDAADNAYLSEGGYLAPNGRSGARPARVFAATRSRRDCESLPLAGPNPDELLLMARFGITYSGGVYCYAQRSYDYFYDALVRAWAAAKLPH